MAELSVIIPFCNEYPQVIFTIQAIAEELKNRVDFEIIAIDNFCEEVRAQGREPDDGYKAIAASLPGNPWLKLLKYEKKLSHWQSKNLGVKNSTGKYLWFTDAHTMIGRDSLFNMYYYYLANERELNGTLHLPLTYKILESKRLVYKLKKDPDAGLVHYAFTAFTPRPQTSWPAPCMSTCGMLMSRKIYDDLGGWPEELGIYGGGENFINFTLAVLGYQVNIFGSGVIFHHGDKRGYSYNYNDLVRNRAIAVYLFGGESWAGRFINGCKGHPETLKRILTDVIDKCFGHRLFIEAKQKITIDEWLALQGPMI